MWFENLRIMKNRSGLTTKEISVQSGIPEPTLEKLFAGTTKDPKLNTIITLVHFFGYSLDDLEQPIDSKKKSPGTDDSVPRGEKETAIINLVGQLDAGQKDFLIALLEKVVSQTQSAPTADSL